MSYTNLVIPLLIYGNISVTIFDFRKNYPSYHFSLRKDVNVIIKFIVKSLVDDVCSIKREYRKSQKNKIRNEKEKGFNHKTTDL